MGSGLSAEHRHLRHKPPTPLATPRELVVVVPHVRSQVNLSRIVRAAGCCGVRELVALGVKKVDRTITRDAAEYVHLHVHRSLPPVLDRYREHGFRLVALEQATASVSIYHYPFVRRSLLLLGHEREGLDDATLALVDDVVEIPIYGQPFSHNLATAAAIAMYEYCRQFPAG